MTQAMPWVFASLAALALGGTVVAFWQAVRAMLGLADSEDAHVEGTGVAGQALLERKQALLHALRELDFDHEAGKLSDEDHREEKARLRAEAKIVMQEFDATIAPYREGAEALVAARLAQAPREEPSFDRAPATALVCAACGTSNDPDAAFCKRCGGKLGEAVPS